MYSESVGRAQYHGIAFIATYICKSMALFEGIESAKKKQKTQEDGYHWEEHKATNILRNMNL